MQAPGIRIIAKIMIMNEPRPDLRATLRLMTWLSPAFPTGSYGYSAGLETCFENGVIKTYKDFQQWLEDVLTSGPGWNDGVLCALAWAKGKNKKDASALAVYAECLAPSKERHLETMAQGEAFLAALSSWPNDAPRMLGSRVALPVAVGVAARSGGATQAVTVACYLSAYSSALIQAALRMGRFGQGEGAALTAALEPVIINVTENALQADLSDIGSATLIAEMMSISHETLTSRIFVT